MRDNIEFLQSFISEDDIQDMFARADELINNYIQNNNITCPEAKEILYRFLEVRYGITKYIDFKHLLNLREISNISKEQLSTIRSINSDYNSENIFNTIYSSDQIWRTLNIISKNLQIQQRTETICNNIINKYCVARKKAMDDILIEAKNSTEVDIEHVFDNCATDPDNAHWKIPYLKDNCTYSNENLMNVIFPSQYDTLFSDLNNILQTEIYQAIMDSKFGSMVEIDAIHIHKATNVQDYFNNELDKYIEHNFNNTTVLTNLEKVIDNHPGYKIHTYASKKRLLKFNNRFQRNIYNCYYKLFKRMLKIK